MSEVVPEELTEIVEDVEIPCECTEHERVAPSDACAIWIVWQLQCCPSRAPLGFMCDECVQAYLTFPGHVRCSRCGTQTKPARRTILRIEPIRTGQ